jgi:hypothetical protein
MAYTKRYPGGWKNKPDQSTPFTAAVGDQLEQGIFDAAATADAAASVIAGRLSETELRHTIGEAAGTLYRRVELPAGLFYVHALSIPANKHLTGAYARAYTTVPTTGTRLRCASTSQTTPVVTMNGRSKLTEIGVFGAAGTPSHPVVSIASNGAVLRDCAIGFGTVGVAGNYRLAILENVHVYANTGNGVENLLDGKVALCTINSNGGNGVSQLLGANATEYIGNRVEWNTGHGFNLFECSSITLLGNISDRNGRNGIRTSVTVKSVIVGNKIKRNGRLSEGVVDDDVNIRIGGDVGLILSANFTDANQDDGGGGYLSPAVSLRVVGGTDTIIAGNDLRGGTARSVVDVSPSTNAKRYGNQLLSGEVDTYIGPSYTGTFSANSVAAAGGVGTGIIYLPSLAASSTGRVVTLEVTARNHSFPTTAYAARVDVVVARPGTADAVATAALTNLANTAFGIGSGTFQVAVSVNADGSALTVSITNTASTAVASFTVRAK